jgi:RNA-directed DNA polymerase
VTATLLLEKHPEKTNIGRVEKGFDFLGYQLQPGRLEVSAVSKWRLAEHSLRLFEGEQGQSDCLALLGAYVR